MIHWYKFFTKCIWEPSSNNYDTQSPSIRKTALRGGAQQRGADNLPWGCSHQGFLITNWSLISSPVLQMLSFPRLLIFFFIFDVYFNFVCSQDPQGELVGSVGVSWDFFFINLTNRPYHEIVIPEFVGSIWECWDFVWPIHLTNHVMFPDERLLDHIWPNLFDYWDIAGVRRFCWARSPGGRIYYTSIYNLLNKISRWPKRRLPLSQNKHFAIPNSGEVFQLVFNNIKVLFNKGMKNSWEIFEVFLRAENDPKLMCFCK